jgi:hypothetical protein
LRIITIVLLAASLAGCGTYKWEKPGVAGADFRSESEECRQQPIAAGQEPGLAWENCMMGRGWRHSSAWF